MMPVYLQHSFRSTLPEPPEPIEWAVCQHTLDSLLGPDREPYVIAVEGPDDLFSWGFRWSDDTVQNVVVTILARGFNSEYAAREWLDQYWILG